MELSAIQYNSVGATSRVHSTSAGQPNKMSEMIEMFNGNGFWPTGLYVFESKTRGNAGIKSQAINEQ